MADLRLRWPRRSALPADASAAPKSLAVGAKLDLRAWLALGAILAVALALRWYNANWDDNSHLHPDERFISIVAAATELPASLGEYFDSARSPLNPYNRNLGFVYGTFPLFLTKGVASLLGRDNYDQLVIVGRHLSALFAVGTVLLAFALGRRLYGTKAGLIGALLLAFAPLAIQQAHFLVVDPFLTFFTTAVLYFCVRIIQEGRRLDFALAGLCLGLGAASKVTAVALLPVAFLAVGVRFWPALSRQAREFSPFPPQAGRRPPPESPPGAGATIQSMLAAAFLLVFVSFIAFRIAQPYAFPSPKLGDLAFWNIRLDDRWVRDQKQQNLLLSGKAGFPPSVQWIGRTPYLYPLKEMVVWGMGPALGIAGWAGAGYAAYRLIRRRDARQIIPLAFLLLYFGFMGRQFSLYLRYYLPIYPVLAIFAGYLVVDAARAAAQFDRRQLRLPRLRPAILAAGGLVVVLTVLWGLAYASIYTRPTTRVEASRWLYANLPVASSIAVEHWDETVPFRPAGSPDKQFKIIELPLYELDNEAKVKGLVDRLDQAQYVVISSNRLLNSIPRVPAAYPVTSRYYDLLLQEKLGFRLLRRFTSYPGLLGIEAPDSNSEEAWTSYDHPPVLVFEKTRGYSSERALALLQPAKAAGAVYLSPSQAGTNALLLRPGDLETQREGGTWTNVFRTTGVVRDHPLVFWLLVVEAAAFAVTPAAFLVFRRLPDRGYLLTKPLGLLLLAYPVWLTVSLKLVRFERATILAWLLVMLAGGAFLAVRKRAELGVWLRRHWPALLVGEALFLLAFLAFYELRLINPDLWHAFRGGEKPMDLAYLTAVTRSTTLPPYDPWFAGGYINYYYLGQFFTATVTKLTAILPEIAFNLAVPTFFAMTVAAAYSVSYNLAAAARQLLRRRPNRRAIPGWSAIGAGILGAAFVAVLGNLDGVGQMVDRLSAVSAWHVSSSVPLLGAVANSVGGLWQVVFHGADIEQFDFWRPSRMMPPTISITEFPYFSFLFADLHAHMMAIPFGVLAIGASLGLVLERKGERRAWPEWALVALLGLIVGSLRWLNSWDYPPFLLLALAALVIGERRAEGGVGRTALRLAAKAGLLIGLSLLLYWPFLRTYEQPVSGLRASPETTPLHQYLAHFGLFAAVVAAWLLFQLLRALRHTPAAALLAERRRAGFRAVAGAYGGMDIASQLWLSAAVTVSAVLFALVLRLALAGLTVIAAMVPVLFVIAYLAWRELRLTRPDGGVRLFLLAMLGLAFGLSAGVDLVTINGDIQRMNTVFKFYLHVWVLLGLVAAFGVWYLLLVAWSAAPLGRPRALATRLTRSAGVLALAGLVLGAAIYPVAATPVRLRDRFVSLPKTLDGAAYMREAVYNDPKGPIRLEDDYEGIQWLRRNVRGTPTIVEGRTPDLYRWGSRFSIYTGLPTVLGWDWHQRQQRGKFAGQVSQRAELVDKFYGDPDEKAAVSFLSRFDVRYVIVGRLERLYYPEAGLRKFESGLDGAIEVVFRNATLTIYRVKLDSYELALKALP